MMSEKKPAFGLAAANADDDGAYDQESEEEENPNRCCVCSWSVYLSCSLPSFSMPPFGLYYHSSRTSIHDYRP
jgi:hypothetical protein